MWKDIVDWLTGLGSRKFLAFAASVYMTYIGKLNGWQFILCMVLYLMSNHVDRYLDTVALGAQVAVNKFIAKSGLGNADQDTK